MALFLDSYMWFDFLWPQSVGAIGPYLNGTSCVRASRRVAFILFALGESRESVQGFRVSGSGELHW